jgi:NAD(P)-dependent dehydrogenase (short-subunit alcohol dehydrogenase family)
VKAAGKLDSKDGRVLGVATNVTSGASVEAMVEATLEAFGRIDILVNNAGITGASKPLWELDYDT